MKSFHRKGVWREARERPATRSRSLGPIAKDSDHDTLTHEEIEALRALNREELAVFANLHRRVAGAGKEGCCLMHILNKISGMDFDQLDALIAIYNTEFFPSDNEPKDDFVVVPSTNSTSSGLVRDTSGNEITHDREPEPDNHSDQVPLALVQSDFEPILLRCGHSVIDLREECPLCQQHMELMDRHFPHTSGTLTSGVTNDLPQATTNPAPEESHPTSVEDAVPGEGDGGCAPNDQSEKGSKYCDVCKIWLNGAKQYDDHILGSKHNKKAGDKELNERAEQLVIERANESARLTEEAIRAEQNAQRIREACDQWSRWERSWYSSWYDSGYWVWAEWPADPTLTHDTVATHAWSSTSPR